MGGPTEFVGLVVELKLEAVGAVELLPEFTVSGLELPCPVVLFDAFQLA